MGDLMGEPTRETKHTAIEGAIRRMHGAADQLEEFTIKVREGATPPKTETETVTDAPSLQGTLDTASNKIEAIRESILKSIAELNASLF